MINEIKRGDKVRVSKDAPKLLFTRSICNYPEYVFEVRAIEEELADIYYSAGKIPLAAFVIPTKYLIKVEDEAKEPKFNVGDKVVVSYSTGDKMGRIQEVLYDGYYDIDYGGGCTGHHISKSRLVPYTEPTAPTIKVGDFVRVLENLHEPICLDVERHLEITNMPPHAVSQKEWKVISVEMRRDCAGRIYTLKHDDSFIYNIPEDCVERVEPTEQPEAEEDTRIRQLEAELDEFRQVELDRVSHPEKYHTYEVTVDNVAMDWQSYEADLAKEIALKVANKHSDPKEAADYAVSVAKAVVENLKKK